MMPGLPVPQQTAQNLWQLNMMMMQLNPLLPVMQQNAAPQMDLMRSIYSGVPNG